MSTKISIADTRDWEAFRRMWDGPEVLHIRATVRVGEGHGEADHEPEKDVEIILPTRWVLEIAAALYQEAQRDKRLAEVLKEGA